MAAGLLAGTGHAGDETRVGREVAVFQSDLEAIIGIVADDGTDLFRTVPSNDEHTVLREVPIVADHNAYHIGELGILRQVTGAWSMRHSVK